jgi:putative flippase GtrA
MNTLKKELFRYGLVCCFTAGADFVCYLALLHNNINYLTAGFSGFVLGNILNYLLSTRFAFSHRTYNNRKLEFIIFLSLGITSLLVHQIALYSFVSVILVSKAPAKICASGVTFFWTFFIRKKLLFTPPSNKGEKNSQV